MASGVRHAGGGSIGLHGGEPRIGLGFEYGFMLLDPVASTQTNRFTFLSAGAAISTIMLGINLLLALAYLWLLRERKNA